MRVAILNRSHEQIDRAITANLRFAAANLRPHLRQLRFGMLSISLEVKGGERKKTPAQYVFSISARYRV